MKKVKSENSGYNNYSTIRLWSIVLCGAMFYCYQFIIRVSPNVMHDNLLHNFNINESMFGFLVGLYYWGYSAVQLPLGLAMDKLGPRRIITIAILLCAVACYTFSQTTNVMLAGVSRIAMGVGAASGFMGALKLGSLWLPARKMGIVTAITMVFGTLGASLGGAPLKMFTNIIGWKQVYVIFSLIGVCLAIITYFIVRDKRVEGEFRENRRKKDGISIFSGLLKVMKTPQTWLVATFGALMYMPITVMGIAWGIPFLKKVYNISEMKAAPIAASMFIGAALGSPIFAVMSDYFKSRKLPMLVGGILCCSIWIIITNVTGLPIYVMYILFFFGGLFYTAKILTFTSNCEMHPVSVSAVTVGFTNMIVMLTGALSHPLVGALLKYKTRLKSIASVEDYRFALSIVPICLFLGLILLYFIKDSYPVAKSHS